VRLPHALSRQVTEDEMKFTSMTLAVLLAATTFAAEPLGDADAIVARANQAAYYAGDDGRSEVRMIIADAQGRQQRRQFTVLRRDIADGGDQQFLVVFSQPADVRNTVFLVQKHVDRDDDRWLYLPGLDLVKRISAGDKRPSAPRDNYSLLVMETSGMMMMASGDGFPLRQGAGMGFRLVFDRY
jgi:hypothetical protein